MNASEPLDACDQHALDLLVDGELTPEQERAVLAQLDQCPDGWRRCALAFLEARVWKEQVRQLPGLAPPDDGVRRATPSSGTWHNHWTWALALAAVFLMAIGLGQMLPRWPAATSPNGPGTVAGQTTTEPSPMLAKTDDPAPKTNATQAAPQSGKPVGNLTLVDDAGNQVQVPVFNWDQKTAERLLFQAEPLPQDLVTHLKRHEVRRHQRYVPLKLKDGRRVLVPIQELDLVPVRGTAY